MRRPRFTIRALMVVVAGAALLAWAAKGAARVTLIGGAIDYLGVAICTLFMMVVYLRR